MKFTLVRTVREKKLMPLLNQEIRCLRFTPCRRRAPSTGWDSRNKEWTRDWSWSRSSCSSSRFEYELTCKKQLLLSMTLQQDSRAIYRRTISLWLSSQAWRNRTWANTSPLRLSYWRRICINLSLKRHTSYMHDQNYRDSVMSCDLQWTISDSVSSAPENVPQNYRPDE